ncbi:hypothetical protein COCCADRAFT_39278 [Bipolaris zeicola 26-R-13]|uniref:Uncharacterized protein n=1 Tax=Cochliobolus carbonum (strain 26-R-13) TaxID=930089 RepID=W6XSF6_COCC2|nr:uncharacterized protein COCCADRAFT_39278 [Bipolaris zeicola 26-R-13]EUC30507.1 hypothetical protein COCCADRAFT_39278 [Bipolaris zeicola 26-R-13]
MCLKLLPTILLLHFGFVAVLSLAEYMGLLNMTNISSQQNHFSVTRQYGISIWAEIMALDTRQRNLTIGIWLDIASTPVDVHLCADSTDTVVSAYRLMHAL